MKFMRKMYAKNSHENLFLNLPEYGSPERIEKVALLERIIKDYASTELPDMTKYCKTPIQREWFHASFGEHYKLINSLCKSLEIQKVVEVGTFTGMSALVWLLNEVTLTSIDIVPWNNFNETVLNDTIISNANFDQKILNLMDSDRFMEMTTEFIGADLIFLDGPKDGNFEQKNCPEIN